MKRSLFLIAAAFAFSLFVAGDAKAGIQYKQYQDLDEPTTTSCNAYSRYNQGCKACVQDYDAATGQPTSIICAFVRRNAACSCKTTSPCAVSMTSCSYI